MLNDQLLTWCKDVQLGRQINTDNPPILESLDPSCKVDPRQVEKFLDLMRTTPKLPDNSDKVITGDYVKYFGKRKR
jgi:hypothetical protein